MPQPGSRKRIVRIALMGGGIAVVLLLVAGLVLWRWLPRWAPDWVLFHSPWPGPALRAFAWVPADGTVDTSTLLYCTGRWGSRLLPAIRSALAADEKTRNTALILMQAASEDEVLELDISYMSQYFARDDLPAQQRIREALLSLRDPTLVGPLTALLSEPGVDRPLIIHLIDAIYPHQIRPAIPP